MFSIECVFHRKCVIDMASNAGQVIIECVFYRMCILQIFYRYVIDMALTAGQDGMLEAGWELPSISLAARDPAAAVRICMFPCACLCAPGWRRVPACARAISLSRSLALSVSLFLSLSLSLTLSARARWSGGADDVELDRYTTESQERRCLRALDVLRRALDVTEHNPQSLKT